MATKPLRSIKWPNLPDRYWVVQPDGNYQQMTVGNAEQLVATVGIDDKVPYNFRTSGGSNDIGDREVDKVVGGTVVWNQMVKPVGNDATNWYKKGSDVTFSVSNGVITFSSPTKTNGIQTVAVENIVPGHRYYIACTAKASSNLTLYALYGNIGSAAGTFAITTEWKRIANVLTGQSVSNGMLFYIAPLTDNALNITVDIKDIIVVDMTKMFGHDIAEYFANLTQDGKREWFERLFPKPYYAYNAGELMHVQTSAHKMTGFNAWDISTAEKIRGTYNASVGSKLNTVTPECTATGTNPLTINVPSEWAAITFVSDKLVAGQTYQITASCTYSAGNGKLCAYVIDEDYKCRRLD